MSRQSCPKEVQLNISSFLDEALKTMDEIASQLWQWNWIDTTGASFSVRIPESICIDAFAMTPTHSGFRRWKLNKEGLVVLNGKLEFLSYSTSRRRAHPSAIIHQYVYANFTGANAILHVHAPYSLAFASLKKPINPFTQQSQMLGQVPCIESDVDDLKDRSVRFIHEKEVRFTSGMEGYKYARDHFLSLVEGIGAALKDRSEELERHGLAFTVYKHGVFVMGRTLDEVFDNLIRIERNCQVQILSRVLDISR